MDDFNFIYTDDGSVGMYDNNAKDILHSKTGALKESIDKFISSTNFDLFCINNQNINILDICYGIGYNTKAAIISYMKNNSNACLNISALDINKNIAFLSPFINDGITDIYIDLYLMSYFLYNFQEYQFYVNTFFNNNKEIVNKFFRQDICLVFDFYLKSDYKYTSFDSLFQILHNIYYQNVSKSMKNSLNPLYNKKINFSFIQGDARQTAFNLNFEYDFIFLDAYTPHKQPILWTYEFLSLLKSKISNNGFLATYSNSTPVRKALLDLGFNIGKIILYNQQFGTIASLNSENINSNFDNYDLELLNTRAGIPYRDSSLTLSSKVILQNRENEIKNSNKISTTEFKKRYKNEI
ncbi:hypothetical protein IJG14_05885 [bacterium]|nr:hypothetical protein [bacterium]